MLSKEQDFFLRILSDHINSRETIIPDDLDKSTLASISKIQQCDGIVFFQTHFSELQSSLHQSIYLSANRKNKLNQIHAVFSANHIPYLIFKGSEIAQYYPVPQLRTMSDSDILIHEKDKFKAHELLRSIGFVCYKQGDMEWNYRNNEIEIELHDALIFDELVTKEQNKNWTDKVWEHSSSTDGIQYHIELEYHLVYLLIHISKHFLNSGVGFRQFLDVAVLSKQEIDWDKVDFYLKEAGMQEFAQRCFTFINKWFGLSTRIASQIDDAFYSIATKNIFENGVFGFNNERNCDNRYINTMQKNGRFLSAVQTIFPSYKYMCSLKEYSFVNGKCWLLPIAWLYRFIRAIRDRRVQKGLNDTITYMTDRTKQQEDYFKSWGLL